MTIDLHQLQQLAAQATSGPWSVQQGDRALWINGGLDEPDGAWPICDMEITGARIDYEKHDVRFIAACSPDTVTALTRVVQAALELDDIDIAIRTYDPDRVPASRQARPPDPQPEWSQE